MHKLATLGLLCLTAIAVSPLALAQEEAVKPEPKNQEAQREEQARQLQEMRQALGRLQKEADRLRREIAEMQQKAPAPSDEERPVEPFEDLPTPEHFFDSHMRGLDQQFQALRDHLRELRELGRTGARGYGLSVRRDPDGKVQVEVRRRGPEGKEQRETYEAPNPEAFARQYPEVMKKYGLSFGDKGTFNFDVQPWFGFGQGFDRLRERFHGGLPEAPAPPARQRLGVMVENLDARHAKELDLDAGQGLLVRDVQEGTLARKLGIEVGDVILSVNGQDIHAPEDVARALRSRSAGRTVTVEVARPDKGRITLKTSRPVRGHREAL